jgi:hypothetical protein
MVARRALAIMTHSRNKILVTTALALIWVAALGYGMQVLWKYETTPGPSPSVASDWPSGSIVPRQPDKPTLLMVAHPHCPCTRASIAELAQIMAHAPDGTTASVLFVKPSGAGPDWDDTDLRRSAAAIPGVSVLTDDNGVEAARFGAKTSGHTLVFDRKGTLIFSGGITTTRGHAGANAGENAALSALRQQTPKRQRTLVFGCSLAQRTSSREGESCLN